MNGRTRGVRRIISDRAITEFLRWLPAVIFFLAYVGNENVLYLSYAFAFAMWPFFKEMRGL